MIVLELVLLTVEIRTREQTDGTILEKSVRYLLRRVKCEAYNSI